MTNIFYHPYHLEYLFNNDDPFGTVAKVIDVGVADHGVDSHPMYVYKLRIIVLDLGVVGVKLCM